jgi:hypothetical protein
MTGIAPRNTAASRTTLPAECLFRVANLRMTALRIRIGFLFPQGGPSVGGSGPACERWSYSQAVAGTGRVPA